MSLERTFDAESEVLSLTDVKTHLRMSGSDDDDALRQFIPAARHQAEEYIECTLVTSTWVLKLDCFQDEIYLPMSPIQSISSVAYIDTDGASQTFANIQFDRDGRLKPSYNNVWPDTRDQFDAVTITYIAGQTHAGNVNELIKQAMLLIIGTYDIGREDLIVGTITSQIPNKAKTLLEPYKKWRV